MRTIIYHEDRRVDQVSGLIPIAGRPMLLRQLDWCRSAGSRDIAIEICRGDCAEQVHSMLTDDAFGRDAHYIFSEVPLGPVELAAQVGFELPVLALSSRVLGDGDLAEIYKKARLIGGSLSLPAPPPLSGRLLDGHIHVIEQPTDTIPARHPHQVSGLGWGVYIVDHEDALTLAHAVLLNELPMSDEQHRWPIAVPGCQWKPGVWVGRGATIHRAAVCRPPVFVGPGAVIGHGAEVGPDVQLGAGAAIAPGATVRRSFIAGDTVVRKGAHIDGAVADSRQQPAPPLRNLAGAAIDTPSRASDVLCHRRQYLRQWATQSLIAGAIICMVVVLLSILVYRAWIV